MALKVNKFSDKREITLYPDLLPRTLIKEQIF